MKIFPMTPFSSERNLGAAYNAAMSILPSGAWAVLMDHDMMLTTREWYGQLEEAIAFRPDAGAFVAVTNRIAAPWQRAQEADVDNHDVAYHRKIGRKRLAIRTLLDVTNTRGFGGVMMCLSRSAWERAGGFVDGILCVDHQMHFALARAGLKVYVLESLYVYHWRRANGDDLPIDTPKAAGCPCRGAEREPRERIALP